MTSQTPRVAPHQQPLRSAIALGVVTAVGLLMALVGMAALFLDERDVESLIAAQDLTALLIVVAIVAVVLLVLNIGATVATLVLSIVVMVKGEGKLRLGAALLLATALFGYVISFSFSGSGSMLPDTAEQAVDLLSVLELVGSIARLVATAVGLVILTRGIGEVRQARRRAL